MGGDEGVSPGATGQVLAPAFLGPLCQLGDAVGRWKKRSISWSKARPPVCKVCTSKHVSARSRKAMGGTGGWRWAACALHAQRTLTLGALALTVASPALCAHSSLVPGALAEAWPGSGRPCVPQPQAPCQTGRSGSGVMGSLGPAAEA